MYEGQSFFQPSVDIIRLLPLFAFLAILIVIVLIVAFALYYRQLEQKRKRDIHWFRSHALDFGLSKQDVILLLRWAQKAKVKRFARLLTNVEAFERLIRYIEKRNNSTQKKLGFNTTEVGRIRASLFGKDISPDQEIETTFDLRPGLRLYIRYILHKNQAVWGHLIDIEEEGIIVVIPNPKEIKVPLRPDTSLEITAYIPNRDPVSFNTKVKSAIPGPRKMVVLEHSTFKLPHKRLPLRQPTSNIPPLIAHSTA